MRVFSEEQKFTQWWVQLIILGTLIVIIMSIVISVNNLKNYNSAEFYIPIVIGGLTSILLVIMGYILKLKTRIDENGIHYGFYPFQKNLRIIRWNEIENIQVRKYNPMLEYGGWGYRFGRNGRAYNVSGNKGIQIVKTNGSNLLIGTNKPKEAAKVLAYYSSKYN